jgi:hypothetical protein
MPRLLRLRHKQRHILFRQRRLVQRGTDAPDGDKLLGSCDCYKGASFIAQAVPWRRTEEQFMDCCTRLCSPNCRLS